MSDEFRAYSVIQSRHTLKRVVDPLDPYIVHTYRLLP